MAKNDTTIEKSQIQPEAPARDVRHAILRLVRKNGKGEHAGQFNAALAYDANAPEADVPVLTKRAGKLFQAGVMVTARGMELQLQGSRIVVTPSALGYFRRSTPQAVSEVLEVCAAYIGGGQKNVITVDTLDQ